MNCKQMHTFFLYDALEVLLLYPLIFLQPDLVQLHEIWSLTRNAFRAEGKHVRFSLSSSVSPFLHIHLQLCSVPCWKHYWMSCVSKARHFFFFGGDQTMAPRFWQHTLRLSQQAHSCSCYMNSWLLVLKNRSSGWLCFHLPSEAPGSAQRTHCLQCVEQPPFPGAKSFPLALWGGRQ